MKRKCFFFHNWEDLGMAGPLSLISECTKCGWQKVFNGALNEEYIYPPNTYRKNFQ